MPHPIEIGVFLPTMSTREGEPGDVVAAARHAEALGFGSVWAVDQLVAGSGVPFVESVVALSAAAGATTTVALGLGVLVLPLRPVPWIAKQVGSLQRVSAGRLQLGVGVGGDRHDRSWTAIGVPRSERGRRADAALDALPGLLRGEEVDGLRLSPPVDPPPILVGGGGEAALRRTVRHGDGWFALPIPPAAASAHVDRLTALADEAGRSRPTITGGVQVALPGDPALPSHASIEQALVDPDGMFGMPRASVASVLVTSAVDVRGRVAAWQDLGAERVVFTLVAGDWFRQAELLAGALA